MEGLSSLGINVPTLIAQIVNFAILFALLYLVAYKPIMRMLDERSRRIKESMEQTDQIREQAAKAEQETARRIEEAGKEAQNIIGQAVQAGEEAKQKTREDAQKEGEKLVTRARAEIDRERDEAIGELRKEFADLTVLAAGKVIDRSLDKEKHRRLIEQVLEESTSLKEG
ncbi:MAG: F0F1 ATP synthase subunit B [Dehalococcoidales bacterium]|nr:F0F1 ATP synthase subunit B [Dehalococcoidales bacterium]